MGLDGVEIFTNSSASHHELRKLHTRVDLIREATEKVRTHRTPKHNDADLGFRTSDSLEASIFTPTSKVATEIDYTTMARLSSPLTERLSLRVASSRSTMSKSCPPRSIFKRYERIEPTAVDECRACKRNLTAVLSLMACGWMQAWEMILEDMKAIIKRSRSTILQKRKLRKFLFTGYDMIVMPSLRIDSRETGWVLPVGFGIT